MKKMEKMNKNYHNKFKILRIFKTKMKNKMKTKLKMKLKIQIITK